jgi:hypothetical protein
MFLTLLALIAIFLIDGTLGKAFNSQGNNKDIFRNDSIGKQCAKEMLRSDQANFYMNSLKSETTTGLFQSMDYVPTFPTGFEPLSLSSSLNKTNGLFQSMDHVPNDFPAITTSSFLQRYVPTTALQAFSATTATTTVMKTPVPMTMTETTKAILLKLDNCLLHPAKKVANYATPRCLLLLPVSNGIAIMTTNPSLLLPFIKDAPAIMTTTLTHAQNLLLPSVQDDPAFTMTNHAKYSLQLIVENLFLLCNEDNSETMASSLLLFCVKDAPAIMMATHTDYSLQLIDEPLFTGAKQVASATIPNESFKLIVNYTKTSLHFREDCGTFCEGEWVQHRRLDKHNDLIGLSPTSDATAATALLALLSSSNS